MMSDIDPIARQDAERAELRKITMALYEALRPLRPTPADYVVTAAMRVMASHVAALDEDKRQKVVDYVMDNFESNVEFFVNNPVVTVVKPS
jgi:hypothetical protein